MEKSDFTLACCPKGETGIQELVMNHKQESVNTDSSSYREINGDWGSNTHIDMQKSNYELFLSKWERNELYPLPNCFQVLNISSKTRQPLNNEYQWFNFSILSYSCEQLIKIATKIIAQNEFSTICSVPMTNDIVTQICHGYNPVSYHNFSHGFSLMHMLFQLTKLDNKFRAMFTFQEIGYCLIAALGHDINHPGTNNVFQSKRNTELAREANNDSVLEKMHVKTLFSTFNNKKINIFAKSSNPNKMKQLMTKVILSTDVSKHFKNLQKLKLIVSNQNCMSDNIQNKYFFMEQAFHACDIGNPCLEYQQYINWAALLSYEFNTQTILQDADNVQVTQMLKYTSKKGFYLSQIGFIKNLVYPLWKQLSLTWNGFSFLVENIETNLKLLQIKAEKQVQINN